MRGTGRGKVGSDRVMEASNGKLRKTVLTLLVSRFLTSFPFFQDCGGLLSEGDNQGCYPLDGHILCKTCNSARIRVLTAKASTDL